MTTGRPTTVMGRLQRPSDTGHTTIAVIGDPHIPRPTVESPKLFRPELFLQRAVEDVNARSVDTALFVGDLTMDGFDEEFDRFDDIVADLDVPWVAIPGNHDVWKSYDPHDSPSEAAFERRYASGGLPVSIERGGVDVIALDSASDGAVDDTHDGVVGSDQIDWLDERLSGTTTPIVALHHALPSMVAQFDAYRENVDPELGTPPVLREPDPLIETLLKHEVPLVLTGHLHIPSIAEIGELREVNAPATSTFPAAYLVLEVGASGTVVRYVPLGDAGEMRTAYDRRCGLKPKAAALAGMAAARTASFPLVDDQNGRRDRDDSRSVNRS